MGGRGETVLYRRKYAKTKEEREALKAEIIGIIDAAVTNITVITLVETGTGSSKQGSS
jgi:hypothetical protein